MCRMLGMAATPIGDTKEPDAAGASPLPVWQHLVGAPHSLRVQAEEGRAANNDGKGHADSWGVSWFDEKGQASLIRQTGSAYGSAYFVFASEIAARGGAGSGPGRVVIGHLRKASCGAVTSENAHPIQVDVSRARSGRETFQVAHNGTVRKPLLLSLRADLENTDRPEKASDSDTVVLAGWLGAQWEAAPLGTSLFDALASSLQTLFVRAEEVAPNGDVTKSYSSVCLLIAHKSGLFALRQFSKEPDYYTLFAAPLAPNAEQNESGGWMVSSEPTGGENAVSNEKWTLMEPGVLTFYPASGTNGVQTATVAPPAR